MKNKLKIPLIFFTLISLILLGSSISGSVEAKPISMRMTFQVDTGTGGFGCNPNAIDSNAAQCRSGCTATAQAGYSSDVKDLKAASTFCVNDVLQTVSLAWLSFIESPDNPGNIVTAWDNLVNALPDAYACLNAADVSFDHALDVTTGAWLDCDRNCPCE